MSIIVSVQVNTLPHKERVTVEKVTINRPVRVLPTDEARDAGKAAGKPKPEWTEVDEEAVLCTLAPGKSLLITDDYAAEVDDDAFLYIRPDPRDNLVRIKDLLEAIERVAVDAQQVQHDIDHTSHNCCQLVPETPYGNPTISLFWCP